MKRFLLLFLCVSSALAQTNTNVINLYSTPKLGTVFNSSHFLVTTSVVNNFTNIAVALQPALSVNTNIASSTNGGVITENNYTDFSLKNFQTLEPPLMFVETWILVPDLNTNISETSILTLATNMVNYGYVTNGWNGILIDEPWLSGHDANGFPVASTNRFPNGMSNLVFKLRSMGITNVGLFASLGSSGVSPDPDKVGNPLVIGHAGYIESDAAYMTTNWGVNFFYLVVDDNGYGGGDNYQKYRQFINASRATGKSVRFLGTTHQFEPWLIDGLESRLWVYDENTYRDSDTSWSGIMRWVDAFPQQDYLVKKGNTLMYGWLGATLDTSYSYPSNRLSAYRTQMGMAAMWHMPMGIGNVYNTTINGVDLKSVLWNRKMQEIQKSTLGAPPKMLYSNNSVQVWSEPFGDFSSYNRYVALLNRDTNSSKTITFTLDKIQVPSGYYVYTNIWSGAGGVVSGNSMTVTVAPYMTEIFEIRSQGGVNLQNLVTKTNPIFFISGSTDTNAYMVFTNYGIATGKDNGETNRPVLYISNDETNSSLFQMGTLDPAYNAFQMLWNPIHENTNAPHFAGEIQITAPQFAIGPGWNGSSPVQIGTNVIGAYRPNRRIQVGIGEYKRGWVDMHFDSPGYKAVDPLGDTLPIRWQVQYYSNATQEVYPTIRGKAYSTNGDYGLELWKNFSTYLDNAILQTNYTLYPSNRYINFFMGRTNLAKFYYDIEASNITSKGTVTLSNLTAAGTAPISVVGPIKTDNAISNSLGGINSAGVVYGSTFRLPRYSVAALPSGIAGDKVYCTDMLTPLGTGGEVVHDGTQWRSTAYGIIPTTLTNQFALNCWESGASFSTKLASSVQISPFSTYSLNFSLTGAGTVSSYDDGFRLFATSTGSAVAYGQYIFPQSGRACSAIGAVVSAISPNSSNCWWDFGFTGEANTNLLAAQAKFVYDRSGLLTNGTTLVSLTGFPFNPSNICIGLALPTVLTNIIDTGIPANVSSVRLSITHEIGKINWITNGVVAFSTNTAIQSAFFPVFRLGKGNTTELNDVAFRRAWVFNQRSSSYTIP